MRILVLSQLFPPDMGGGSTRAANVVKGLARLGHSVTVITAFPHYPSGIIPKAYRGRLRVVEKTRDATVIRTWVPPLESRGLVRRLVLYFAFCISSLLAPRLVREADAVWAANPNVFSVFPAAVIGKLVGVPVIENVDDVWPDELEDLGMLTSPLLLRVAARIARLAYAIPVALTPISQAYVGALVSKYDGTRAPDSYRVIPAGVDLEQFRLDARTPSAGADGREFKVLYIGAFSPAYDFEQVLQAAQLMTSERGVRFVIQGGGELASFLQTRVRELHLENVTVIPNIVSRSEVAQILASADALLLPLGGQASIEMGISSKLYEYQASGKPIICCSLGESAAYVSRTQSGIVVHPGDPTGIVHAVHQLQADVEASTAFGRAGRTWVEANLSCEKIGRMFESVIEDARARRWN